MGLIVKNTTSPRPFDLLVPHSCRGCGRIGEALCDRCKNYIKAQHQNLCPNCKTPNSTGICQKCKNLPPIFVVAERHDLIDDLIHDYKYSSNRALAKPLAEILDYCLPTINTPVVIIPLPTINKHLRERALDHTLLIAKHLAKLHSGWKVQKALIRATNTVQVGSTKAERLSQASKAFQISPKFKITPNATYLLVDDVWTTGSSMQSAIQKLRQAGVSNLIVGLLAVSRLDS